ncbi:MAG: electron transfer flavoprotein subunit beta/FixA family protein [Firmicutes bacterium]|nr:electron transfer flavoprotein subunit beta/FixA family protein [Bacillota bacterium]
MHIIVCVKQVPDTTEVKIDPVTNTLDRSGAPSILNPYDAHAVEEAVSIKERLGGKVTVISMGPPGAVEVIKKCISMGVDEGFLLSDAVFAGSDTLATSYILYSGIDMIARQEPFHILLCGKQAIDGDTAQVGPGIARRFNLPQLTYVDSILAINSEEKSLKVRRKLEDGYEIVQSRLPCLITVEKSLNELRYSSLPNMLRGARYRPSIISAKDMEADQSMMGLKGSATSVTKIFPPPQRNQGEIFSGDAQSAVDHLIDKLEKRVISNGS